MGNDENRGGRPLKKGVDSLKFAAGTDKGLLREINEDSCMIIPGCSSSLYAFIIADGMGGHNCGEIASRMTVDFVSESIRNSSKLDDEISSRALQYSGAANRECMRGEQRRIQR